MIAYWVLLLVPVWFCLKGPCKFWSTWQSWFIGISLTLFIGLRHEIGGDWFAYLPYLERTEGLTVTELLPWTSNYIGWGDPGYNLLNWLFDPYPWSIYGANLVFGAIFSDGLVLFFLPLLSSSRYVGVSKVGYA